MNIYDHITELTGHTPLVRIAQKDPAIKCTVAAKVEAFNPGGSVKDRIAAAMLDAAERDGLLKPGGTIIEGTSGNTGLGLALLASARGYKCIFTIPDKMSQEKINLLKAFGAEVIVCPTAVEPEDPRSYYSVAKRLNEEIPNSVYPNQYQNPNNPDAHYRTTGPEIWEDTDGKVTHFVCGMGTGGTISGVGRYLKEQRSDIKIIGVDPLGSLYNEYFHTGKIGQAHTYKIEGIGEDIIPGTIDFSFIDDVIQVTDKESFNAARRLCRTEGIFTGGSGGSALVGALRLARSLPAEALLVVLLPDTGERYLSKVFNDAWMKENQFLEPEVQMSAAEIARRKQRRPEALITVTPATPLTEAMDLIKRYDVSQIPVVTDGDPIGSIREDRLIDTLLHTPNVDGMVVDEVMSEPLPIVDADAGLDEIFPLLTRTPGTPGNHPAVLVRMPDKSLEIITKYDLVQVLQR
ncbi:MAG: cystathionine beta-synthase [Gammaproteobacteria bacterium]|nr:cystathionine beta-synthase [Gammaproteobacteria bacterium]NIR83416.1 cystathionine beta-synthase [Gammaproteobacteria bacterium]NIR91338.1 cystathionine beta-synthase [Gammaproteobacteria bacterium]NIU04578.1 cystathionine beta-synthase [Gammaproteobacteria bacterium]NIV51620.1 cystathionine beta-synthase [Gammaproteobacteria bacterium]